MINFVVKEMTCLRYFAPLIHEAFLRGIQSRFYVGSFNKYNCPFRHPEVLSHFVKTYRIEVCEIEKLKDAEDLTFYIEDVGIDQSGTKNKKIVLTYQNDFVNEGDHCYHKYIDAVDHVIFPSKFVAEYHKTVSDKNLYLGSPKYDIVLNRDKIIEKYDLPKQNNILVLFPKLRDLDKSNIVEILSHIKGMSHNAIIKTRGKDRVESKNMRGDRYFEDVSWFPHTTMELMAASDLVINFGSTAIKECVMMRKPVINFPIKPHNIEKTFPFLYGYDYCDQHQTDCGFEKFQKSAHRLISADHTKTFDEAIEKHLFNYHSSKKIISFFEEEITNARR